LNIALVLSGGGGTRLGADIPKQYIEVGGKPIITYCIEQLSEHHRIDAIHIVADASWHDRIMKWLHYADRNRKFRGFSLPEENQQLSIFHGLEDVRKYATDEDFIFIHNAARPLLSDKIITDCLSAAKGHDGVLPVLPMKDTVYLSEDGKRVSSLINRSKLFAGQAPEVFVVGKYYRVNKRLMSEEILKINGSTEPAVMAGMDIAMILGDERNLKITTKQDLERFRQIIERM